MNMFIARMMGHYLMDAAAEAGGGGGDEAPAAAETPAPATDAPAAKTQASTLLTEPEKAAEGEQPEGESQEAEKPAAIEYQFETPEGFELDTEVMGKFTALAGELGLTQEQASALVGMQTELMQKSAAAQAEAVEAGMAEMSSRWADEVRNDPVLGQKNFDATRAVAAKAVQAFATPELRDFLGDSGLGNHPEMVKLFHRIGTSLSEDKMVIPGNTSSNQGEGKESIVSAFYPAK